MLNEGFLDQVKQLGFTYDPETGGSADYIGAADLITDEPGKISNFHAKFGAKQRYLRSSNPVIFAAKPGTYAHAKEHPLLSGGPPVAPRAAAISLWVDLLSAREDDPTLKQIIDRVSGWRGTGQIEIEGPISWGDYTTIDKITSRIRPSGLKSVPDVGSTLLQTLKPGVGVIEDFALSTEKDEWFVLTKNWDESFPKFRWDLWRFRKNATSESLASDIPFPKIESAATGLLLYTEGDEPRTKWAGHNVGSGTVLHEDEYIVYTFPSADRSTVFFTDADSTHGTDTDELLETSGSAAVVKDRFDLTAYEAIARTADEACILASSERDGEVFRRHEGKTKLLRKLSFPPREIVATPDSCYFFSWNNRAIVRWDLAESWQMVELLGEKEEILAPFEFWKGGCEVRNGHIYLASKDTILVFDESKLAWRELDPAD